MLIIDSFEICTFKKKIKHALFTLLDFVLWQCYNSFFIKTKIISVNAKLRVQVFVVCVS